MNEYEWRTDTENGGAANLSKPKRAQNPHTHSMWRQGIYMDMGARTFGGGIGTGPDFLAQLKRRRMSVKIASGM